MSYSPLFKTLVFLSQTDAHARTHTHTHIFAFIKMDYSYLLLAMKINETKFLHVKYTLS